jgi:hypothetical protein
MELDRSIIILMDRRISKRTIGNRSIILSTTEAFKDHNMYQITYPKTKSELITAIQKAEIVKIDLFESGDKRINDKLRTSTQPNIRRTVIIIEERR